MKQRPDIKPELREVILKGLSAPYTSMSCQDDIPTGNHYQSIMLDDERTSGFRTARDEFLDRLPLAGKTVLDLGSNLGEISRAARARGAALVDGWEYDPYFIDLANAINAHNGVSRVSFFQLDIADAANYREQYDVVLALSVYIYIAPILDAIALVTGEILVLETHKLEPQQLQATYIDPITRHFPHYLVFGESEWGIPHGEAGKRAVIAFAKSPSVLRGLFLPSSAPAPVDTDARTLSIMIDPRRTPWYDRFFSTWTFESADELLAAMDATSVDVDILARSPDLPLRGRSGCFYWLLYLKGCLQFEASKTVDGSNPYFDYLLRYSATHVQDPAVVEQLSNEATAQAIVRRRFADFSSFRARAQASPTGTVESNPVTFRVRRKMQPDTKLLYEVGSGRPVQAGGLDGYHRLFLARLFKYPGIRGTGVVEDSEALAGSLH